MWEPIEYRQCTRCVMDTSDPEIVFDAEGRCNHCTEYVQRIAGLVYQGGESDSALEAMFAQVREAGRGRPYDSLIGVSGGVDSSYVAYLAKKHGLRPLAVHMDNGWNSEEAVKNIKRVCSKLGVDYQSYVLDWDEFKDIQLAFLKASIIEMEIPTDVAIQGALHKVAAENGIRYLLSGGNLATEAIMPRCWFYYPKDAKLLKSICRLFGKRKPKTFPTFDYPTEIYYKFFKGIKILYPLNHVAYVKDDAMKLLKEEFDWVDYGGKHHESKFTKIVLNYIQPVKFNVDYRRATYSTQICMGTMTREEALEKLKVLPYDPVRIEEEKDYVAKKLGVTPSEFEAILKLPPRSYRDYPNNEKFLQFAYGSYRKLFPNKRSVSNAGYQ